MARAFQYLDYLSSHPGKSPHKQGHQTMSGDKEGFQLLYACAAALHHTSVDNPAHHWKLGVQLASSDLQRA